MENLDTIIEKTPAMEVYKDEKSFELAQRIAGSLAKSDLVPKEYHNNIPNCLIALEISQRCQMSPLMVMQNLYIVHGRPSWGSSSIIAMINSTGKFSPLQFEVTGEGEGRGCVAFATDKYSGQRCESPRISMLMAKKEGWIDKTGSKWQTMPELMMRYRSATFFGRLYCPERLLGMPAADEVEDIEVEVIENPEQKEARTKIDEQLNRSSNGKLL